MLIPRSLVSDPYCRLGNTNTAPLLVANPHPKGSKVTKGKKLSISTGTTRTGINLTPAEIEKFGQIRNPETSAFVLSYWTQTRQRIRDLVANDVGDHNIVPKNFSPAMRRSAHLLDSAEAFRAQFSHYYVGGIPDRVRREGLYATTGVSTIESALLNWAMDEGTLKVKQSLRSRSTEESTSTACTNCDSAVSPAVPVCILAEIPTRTLPNGTETRMDSRSAIPVTHTSRHSANTRCQRATKRLLRE